VDIKEGVDVMVKIASWSICEEGPPGMGSAYSGKALVSYGEFQHSGSTSNSAPPAR